jgi:hypothetical protein
VTFSVSPSLAGEAQDGLRVLIAEFEYRLNKQRYDLAAMIPPFK